jgi:hypothetical protein
MISNQEKPVQRKPTKPAFISNAISKSLVVLNIANPKAVAYDRISYNVVYFNHTYNLAYKIIKVKFFFNYF